jgi:hypothetical protein
VVAVTAGDDIADQLLGLAVARAEADRRRRAVEVVHAHIVGLEDDLAVRGKPRGDEVLHHLLLSVDGHRPPSG